MGNVMSIGLLICLGFPVFSQYSPAPPRSYYLQKELLQKLKSYRSEYTDPISYTYISPTKSVSDSCRAQLLYLLKNQWEDGELEMRIRPRFREIFERLYFQKILDASISKTRDIFFSQFGEISSRSQNDTTMTLSKAYRAIYDSVFRHTYDSVAYPYREGLKQAVRRQLGPNEIVMAVAFANIKEAIPLLKADLVSATPKFDRNKTELALAKLGDTTYLNKVFRNHYVAVNDSVSFVNDAVRGNDTSNLRILNSQESIAAIADWIDTVHMEEAERPRDGPPRPVKYIYSCYNVVSYIMWSIANQDFYDGLNALPDHRYFRGGIIEDVGVQHLVYIKNWMKANKGKYELY